MTDIFGMHIDLILGSIMQDSLNIKFLNMIEKQGILKEKLQGLVLLLLQHYLQMENG